jgi:protein-S-isoprenylcysteine O-methyltransferase Ste14
MNLDQQSFGIDAVGNPAQPCDGPLVGAVIPSKKSLSVHFSKKLALDLTERAIVLLFFLFFAHRILPRLADLIAVDVAYPKLVWLAATTNLQAALLVISESLGVLLILIRRPATLISTHPLDWALAFVAVNAPLLATPAAASTFMPSAVPTTLMFSGLIIQISAKAVLWRSYGAVPANRGIKTGGPYGFLRHPIYAGYSLTHIGFLLGFPSLHNALLYFAAFSIDVARLLREELILRKDPLYGQYAARVRYRLLPGLF